MRVLHEILNDLTNYPKHDYRSIRATEWAGHSDPIPIFSLIAGEIHGRRPSDRRGHRSVRASKWKSVLLVDLGIRADDGRLDV